MNKQLVTELGYGVLPLKLNINNEKTFASRQDDASSMDMSTPQLGISQNRISQLKLHF